MTIHFSDPAKSKLRHNRKARFEHFTRVKQITQRRNKLQMDDMRGPSEDAGRKRRVFRQTVEDSLEQQGIPSSIPQVEKDVLATSDYAAQLYTDGSCGEQGTTKAGWGVYVALVDTIEQYCAPVSIEPTDALFHGAGLHSNNTGELEALGVALKWVHTYCQPNSVVQINYDSKPCPRYLVYSFVFGHFILASSS